MSLSVLPSWSGFKLHCQTLHRRTALIAAPSSNLCRLVLVLYTIVFRCRCRISIGRSFCVYLPYHHSYIVFMFAFIHSFGERNCVIKKCVKTQNPKQLWHVFWKFVGPQRHGCVSFQSLSLSESDDHWCAKIGAPGFPEIHRIYLLTHVRKQGYICMRERQEHRIAFRENHGTAFLGTWTITIRTGRERGWVGSMFTGRWSCTYEGWVSAMIMPRKGKYDEGEIDGSEWSEGGGDGGEGRSSPW